MIVTENTDSFEICFRLAIVENCRIPDWNTVYDFVADRLRAVRKDLIIQGLHNLDVLPVLEPMVIFHIYSGYRCVDLKIHSEISVLKTSS